ncbi:MAG: type II toxin-antitoxin system HicA family toxin [Planctomycetes bacterium]|nr:type II toxin-antitoxin system HicA family toxin [Planctomycetota bacterium]
MVQFLMAQGYAIVRITGSHHIMQKGPRQTSVPVHGNETLKIGTLRSILRDIDMSPTEFERLWRA